jgi:hypothetical protein
MHGLASQCMDLPGTKMSVCHPYFDQAFLIGNDVNVTDGGQSIVTSRSID